MCGYCAYQIHKHVLELSSHGMHLHILLDESPSLIQIFSGKNVQFVDLSRLPKKYRDRVVGQLQTRKEKLEAERLERVEEARQQVCEGGGIIAGRRVPLH